MLSIPVLLDELQDSALNLVVAGILKTPVKPYITSWCAAGPVIESLGIGLDCHDEPTSLAREIELRLQGSDDREFRWSASCGNERGYGSTPLIAAMRALAGDRLKGAAVRVPADSVLGLVKDEWTVVSFLLESSSAHVVEQCTADPNQYILSARDGKEYVADFKQIIALAEKAKSLSVLNAGYQTEARPEAVTTITVQHQ